MNPQKKKAKAKKPQLPPPMIRLRLPSEKPTREDGDKDGNIFTIIKTSDGVSTFVCNWPLTKPFDGDELAWFSLPDGILPREPSQEEKWRKDFEETFTDYNLTKQSDGEYAYSITRATWQGFLAAKEGGAE
jgi:hypothetical protein